MLSPAMPPMFGAFKEAEDAKAVQIDVEDPTKTVHIKGRFGTQIGKRARQLPPTQQGLICVELSRNARPTTF
jgi:hypothetical protein